MDDLSSWTAVLHTHGTLLSSHAADSCGSPARTTALPLRRISVDVAAHHVWPSVGSVDAALPANAAPVRTPLSPPPRFHAFAPCHLPFPTANTCPPPTSTKRHARSGTFTHYGYTLLYHHPAAAHYALLPHFSLSPIHTHTPFTLMECRWWSLHCGTDASPSLIPLLLLYSPPTTLCPIVTIHVSFPPTHPHTATHTPA